MSATLGPIHYRMYGKAQAVDALARRIAAFSDEQGWTAGAEARLNARHPRLEGDLTGHIDVTDIHGNLNALVGNAEAALACACEPVPDHVEETLEFVKELGAASGRSSILPDASLQDAWTAVDAHWLDGMPCDRFVTLHGSSPETMSWTIRLEPHPAACYEQVRRAWMAGFLSAARIALEASGDGSYRIAKEA